MATSEPLVPQGLEHGERAKLEAVMDAGGVPKNVPIGGAGPEFGAGAPGGAGPVSSPAPNVAGWDVLADREPSGVIPPEEAQTPQSLFQSRIDVTENEAMRYYFGRYQDFLE